MSWPASEIETITQLKSSILASAERHNTPQSNMDDASFAALITTILHWEGRLPGSGKPESEKQKDTLGDWVGILLGYDASTGIANLRPSVAMEILQGEVPGIPACYFYSLVGGEGEITLQGILSLTGQLSRHSDVEPVNNFLLTTA